MKRLLVLSFSFAVLFTACGDSNSSSNEVEVIEIGTSGNKVEVEVLAENKMEVKMEVEGMTCAMGCAKYIENKVGDMDGVVASSVNFEEKIATFEFDKTATSPEEIQEFISNIHDGQYKAKLALSDSNVKIEDNSDAVEEEVTVSMKERISISFPQLFTYFIKKIR
tara:strand:+ start:4392 stop:4889 length:498 start_codon:yes stop_codon:yes gene_type:complete